MKKKDVLIATTIDVTCSTFNVLDVVLTSENKHDMTYNGNFELF